MRNPESMFRVCGRQELDSGFDRRWGRRSPRNDDVV